MIIATVIGFVVINVIRTDSASQDHHDNDLHHRANDQDHHDNDQDPHDNDPGHDHHGNDQGHHDNDHGQALVRSCHRLERLDLEECVLLTDTSISQVRRDIDRKYQSLSANISISAIMPFSPTPPSHK